MARPRELGIMTTQLLRCGQQSAGPNSTRAAPPNAIGPHVRAARATTADVRTSGHLDLQASSHTSGAFATVAKRRDAAAVLKICFAGK